MMIDGKWVGRERGKRIERVEKGNGVKVRRYKEGKKENVERDV